MPNNGKQFSDGTIHQVGFSLLELVIAMAIIAVMSAIAIPRFGSAHARYRVDLAARRIAADIAYARTVARRNGKSQEIIFDIDTNSYTLVDVEDIDHPGTDYIVDLSGSKYGVDLVSAGFENVDGYISPDCMFFTMWGDPQSGCPAQGDPIVSLINGSIVIALGNESRTINITPVTGTASIQ